MCTELSGDLRPASCSCDPSEIRESLADRMEALASELRLEAVSFRTRDDSGAPLLGLARKVHAARRSVDEAFGLVGFAVSPAWDIMLDLYQARILRKQISVTSACIGGACPTTTGLRWLQILEEMHLIVRQPDDHDRRRQVVGLTEAGAIQTEKCLRAYQ